MYTKNEIEQIVSSGKEAMASAFQQYYLDRTKGKYCEDTWHTISFITNLINAINGYDPENPTSFCLTGSEVDKIANTIIELTPTVSPDFIEIDTFILLQEDGFNLLQEDGSNLLWN